MKEGQLTVELDADDVHGSFVKIEFIAKQDIRKGRRIAMCFDDSRTLNEFISELLEARDKFEATKDS